MSSIDSPARSSRVGVAWILQCVALAIQAGDAMAHDFLSYYNATMLTLYGHFSFFPRMDIQSKLWLMLPGLVILALLALTPFAYRNTKRIRRLGLVLPVAGMLISFAQIALTIRGGTVPSVAFDGVSPGFYSSPLLLLTSLYLFWTLRRAHEA